MNTTRCWKQLLLKESTCIALYNQTQPAERKDRREKKGRLHDTTRTRHGLLWAICVLLYFIGRYRISQHEHTNMSRKKGAIQYLCNSKRLTLYLQERNNNIQPLGLSSCVQCYTQLVCHNRSNIKALVQTVTET